MIARRHGVSRCLPLLPTLLALAVAGCAQYGTVPSTTDGSGQIAFASYPEREGREPTADNGNVGKRFERYPAGLSWVGTPVAVLTGRYGLPNRTFQDDKGHTVYQYDYTAIDPTCMYYFVVDPDQIIGDFYRSGWCHSI